MALSTEIEIKEVEAAFQSMEWYTDWEEKMDPNLFMARTPSEALRKILHSVAPNYEDVLVSSMEFPDDELLIWEDRQEEWEEVLSNLLS